MSISVSVSNGANNDCSDADTRVLSPQRPEMQQFPSLQDLSVYNDEKSNIVGKERSSVIDLSGNDIDQSTPSLASTDDQQNNATIYDSFQIIDEVEWGPRRGEPGYDDDQELAPRPRKIMPDPCGCQAVGLSYNETCFVIEKEAQSTACLDDSCVLFATFEECGSNCEAVHTCGNKRLQRKRFCRVEVFDAGIKGKGLRLSKDGTCKKGDIVGEYVGQAIKESHLSRRFRKYERDRRLYIMALGDGVFLDARHKGGLARYINHSCDPNCRVERWKVKGIVRAAVVALRDIKPHEEFTFDYQWERQRGYAPTICHCGSSICRGTLEAPKSLEEADLQKELEGHWERSNANDESIINRTVQIFSSEHQEYFIGEVTNYDAKLKQHCIFYRDSKSEVWEDLKQEDWMILSEKKDSEHFMIARKARGPNKNRPIINSLRNNAARPVRTKNYLYVQTPVKVAIWALHLHEKCERNCSVQIKADQFAKPPLPPNPEDPEEVEKYAALDKSVDGTVWKLTITGSDIPKALAILQKNVVGIEKKLAGSEDAYRWTWNGSSLATDIHSRPPPSTAIITTQSQEVMFPRKIADELKRRIGSIKEKCRNVAVSFIPSESLTKRYGKLVITGATTTDIYMAGENLWYLLQQLCSESDVAKTQSMKYKDLAFEGGTISEEHYNLLRDFASGISSPNDLSYFKSFESNNDCFVWIQDDDHIEFVNKSTANSKRDSTRKIFFGCRPQYVSNLYRLVHDRMRDLARDVKYIYLGKDRIYQPLLMMNSGRLFQYINEITGADVRIDQTTGDHLRIDGKLDPTSIAPVDEVKSLTDGQRAGLALDLVRLQIELYRVNNIRQYSWFFGRDWSLVDGAWKAAESGEVKSELVGNLDRRTVSNHCLEISATVQRCSLPSFVAAHAALIMYRFTYACESGVTNVKGRDAVLACVYLANKAQSAVEWKPLEEIIEAGYSTFYPGALFNRESQETSFQGSRVLALEQKILETLQYDVFWNGVEPLKVALAGAGKLQLRQLDAIVNLAFSSQVLSAGAELWLKFGVEYLFAAAAAILKVDLLHIITVLSLIPMKVFHATELLFQSSKFEKTIGLSHSIFEGSKESFKSNLLAIQQLCLGYQDELKEQTESPSSCFLASGQEIQTTGRESVSCYIIRNVSRDLAIRIAGHVDKVAAESSSSIYIDRLFGVPAANITLKGSWRSVAVAVYLLRELIPVEANLPSPEDLPSVALSSAAFEAKDHPGLLNSSSVETSVGWEGTIQSSCSFGGHLGGKNYVAAKIGEQSMGEAGMAWLFPPKYALSSSGAITDMCLSALDQKQQISIFRDLSNSLLDTVESFTILKMGSGGDELKERFLPVSVQRWPPEKVIDRELKKWKRANAVANMKSLEIGFSPAALREVQLLRRLHAVIPSPMGHPNFVLPVGLAIPVNHGDGGAAHKSPEAESEPSPNEAVSSLFRSNGDAQKTARRSKKIKGSPSIVFAAAPFTLNRILSWKAAKATRRIIMTAWFDDCISVLAHCHANDVIIGSIQPDQILIDQSGVIKIGYLYRCRSVSDGILSTSDTTETHFSARSGRRKDDQEDHSNDYYVAPEILLGSQEYSKESDIWAIGSLLANLLLNKPMFSGKDRELFLTSQYKIVGIPSKSNFPEAFKLPKYTKPDKKYVRDVQKALKTLLKDEDNLYHSHIDLLCHMLHLDPRKRCTATDALGHGLIKEYRNSSKMSSFREEYANDWMIFKRKVMAMRDNDEKKLDDKKSSKRNTAFAVAHDDDLYDIEEIIGHTNKKQRT